MFQKNKKTKKFVNIKNLEKEIKNISINNIKIINDYVEPVPKYQKKQILIKL
jgi:hypothetical protein